MIYSAQCNILPILFLQVRVRSLNRGYSLWSLKFIQNRVPSLYAPAHQSTPKLSRSRWTRGTGCEYLHCSAVPLELYRRRLSLAVQDPRTSRKFCSSACVLCSLGQSLRIDPGPFEDWEKRFSYQTDFSLLVPSCYETKRFIHNCVLYRDSIINQDLALSSFGT
jgi:hypothetical protein